VGLLLLAGSNSGRVKWKTIQFVFVAFSAKHAVLMSKSKYWLARNTDSEPTSICYEALTTPYTDSEPTSIYYEALATPDTDSEPTSICYEALAADCYFRELYF
jgi:hypothetical protein